MTELEKARQIINDVDKQMAELFCERMDAARIVAAYKKEHGLKIDDFAREEQLIDRNCNLIKDEEYKSYYVDFIKETINLSKLLQHRLLDEKSVANNGIIIPVKGESGGYSVYLERGAISKAKDYFKLDRKVLIVTDSGVPREYAETVSVQCKESMIVVFPEGEAYKSFDTYKSILEALVNGDFTRTDCVVAVGGGVVGDMAGFAAATFMRGIDFYNIPTTLLSQVDSSVGGKTAIDFGGYKNIVGAFYQPKGVIIDPDTLKTLPDRQISNGLAEVVKMAMTHDEELFGMLENDNFDIDTVIERSIKIKKSVVEADEKESGLRKVLNFGHTVGHAIESNMPSLYHGECVALGMIPMCSDNVRERLIPVLKKLNLPCEIDVDVQKIIDTMSHDKKMAGNDISVVQVENVGKFEIKEIDFSVFANSIKAVYKK